MSTKVSTRMLQVVERGSSQRSHSGDKSEERQEENEIRSAGTYTFVVGMGDSSELPETEEEGAAHPPGPSASEYMSTSGEGPTPGITLRPFSERVRNYHTGAILACGGGPLSVGSELD